MKILIFSELYVPYLRGGAEVSTQLLAESLSQKGHEIHVCTSSNRDYDEIINDVFIHRRKQHNLYWSLEKEKHNFIEKVIWHSLETYNILGYNSIKKLICQIKPDLIHTNVFTGFSSIIWTIAKQQNIPIVHTLRDYYLQCVRSTFYNKNKNCMRGCFFCRLTSYFKKSSSQKVDAVVGISKFILDFHLNKLYFTNAKIKSVIPNAITKFSNRRSHLQSKDKIIGYLGRIHESKGIEFLIESFLRLNSLDYTLQIAGTGDSEYLNKLQKKYNSKQIQFIGRVNPEEFLPKIRLLVVPSLWQEPFGRVIIEANLFNCPVFASNMGGMPELINKHNGRIFNINDNDSLYYLLKDFTSGKLEFDIKPSYTIEKYDTTNIANQYLTIYYALLNNK